MKILALPLHQSDNYARPEKGHISRGSEVGNLATLTQTSIIDFTI